MRDFVCAPFYVVTECNQVIRSDDGQNGSFSSPSYPTYPPPSHCRYEFLGHGRQRVHLTFVDFDLFRTDSVHGLAQNGGDLKRTGTKNQKSGQKDSYLASLALMGENMEKAERK